MQKTAYYISVLLHPLFIPLYTTFFIFNKYLSQNPKFAGIIYSLLIIDSILLPYFFTRIMARKKHAESIELNSRKERYWPLAFVLYSYAVLAFLFYYLKIGFYMELFFFSVLGVSLIAFLLNFFYKISLHMLAMGTVTRFILAFFIYFKVYLTVGLLASISISAIVASARLFLQEHNPAEIYSGYLVGIFTTLLITAWYYQYYLSHFTIY